MVSQGKRVLLALALAAGLFAAAVAAAPASRVPAAAADDDDEFEDGPARVAPAVAPVADDDDDDPVAPAAEAAAAPAAEAAPSDGAARKEAQHAEEEIVYDDDEFEGFARPKPKAPAANPVASAKPKPLPVRTYNSEIVYACVLSAYLLYFIIGKMRNDSVGNACFKAIKPLLEEQFAAVDASLARDSFSGFILTASGRLNVKGARFLIELVKRQDITAHAFSFFGFLGNNEDLLTVDLLLDTSDPYVFAVCQRGAEKRMREAQPDVKRFAVETQRPQVLPYQSILSDCPSLVPQVLVDDVASVIHSNPDLFVSLKISDQPTIYTTHKDAVLRLIVRLPSDGKMERLLPFLKMALTIADRARNFEANRTDRSRARELRAEAEEERLAKAKEERKEKEKEKEKEQEKESTAESRRRFEEKEAKRRAKALAPKVKFSK